MNHIDQKTSRIEHQSRGGMLLAGVAAVVAGLAVTAVLNRDEKPVPVCTYTVHGGESASVLAMGDRGITDDIVEANNNSAAMEPGTVLELGSAACDAITRSGRPVTPITATLQS